MSIGAPQYRDSNIETLADDKTLTVADAYIQALDPGGSGRTITLPAEAANLQVVIANRADAAEVLTIKDDGGTTIATPTQNETAVCFSDGTAWYGSVGADA